MCYLTTVVVDHLFLSSGASLGAVQLLQHLVTFIRERCSRCLLFTPCAPKVIFSLNTRFKFSILFRFRFIIFRLRYSGGRRMASFT